MKKIISKSNNILISIFLLLYFIALISFSYFNINTNGLNVILELITIPLLLLLLGMLIYNIVYWNKDKFKLNSSHILPIIIIVTCFLILILSTIYNI